MPYLTLTHTTYPGAPYTRVGSDIALRWDHLHEGDPGDPGDHLGHLDHQAGPVLHCTICTTLYCTVMPP